MTWTFLLVLLLVGVAWMTAAATAVRSVSRIWLRHWVERALSGSGTAALYLERPQRLLLAATTTVAILVFFAGLTIASSSRHAPLSWMVQSLLFLVAVLVLGQLVPRAVARRWSTTLIPVLLPPLQVVERLLAPLHFLVRQLTGERVVHQEREARSDDEALEELLREGELEGVGEPTEIAIISGVVHFGDKRVRDVMNPRQGIFAVDEALPMAELARQVAQSGYSRVPVIRGTLDQVIGMVHVFDVLQHSDAERPRIRPVAFTRPSVSCKELLFTMLRERKHLAIVRDETAATLGIVTLEDVLEELVGDIRDEHDEPVASISARS